MNRLPLEVLRFIVEEVPYGSLENLRLVNKTLAAAGAPRLFEAIPVWIGIKSLERLTALSEHPQLSQYPKEIIFSPLRFIDYKDDKVYRAKVQDWLEYQPSSLSSHALAIGRRMSAYRSYIEAQRYLSSEATDVKILARAFTRLPNLEILRLDWWNFAIGSLELMDAFGRFLAEDLVTCDCEYALPTLLRALSSSRTKFKVFKLGRDDGIPYANGGDLSKASRARSSIVPPSRAELPRFASTSNPDTISVDALSKTFHISNHNTCWGALSGLCELSIGEMIFNRSDVNNVSELSRVAAAIRMMIDLTHVETLVIRQISLFHNESKLSLTDTIPVHWKAIRVLEISWFEATLPALTGFFGYYQKSLVKVILDSVTINESGWSTALVQLRTFDFACLEFFTLSWCDDDECELQVQDYIVKKTDVDPLVVYKTYQAELIALELELE